MGMSDVDFMAMHAARMRVESVESVEPDLSRSGRTNPFGPLSEGRKIRLPIEIEQELDRLAHGEGMSYAEYVRDVLVAHVRGPDEAIRMTAERMRRVLRLGSD